MSIPTAIAIFFIVWWVTLFAVLPWRIKSQHETGEVTDGTEPAAPTHPMIVRKLVYTTITAVIIFGVIFWLLVYSGVSLEDIPMLGDF